MSFKDKYINHATASGAAIVVVAVGIGLYTLYKMNSINNASEPLNKE